MGGNFQRRVAASRACALRDAVPSDRDLLYRIKSDALQPYAVTTWGPWDEPRQRRRFDESFDHARFRVVVIGQDPIGFLETTSEGNDLRLLNIALVERWRGRGIGARLIRDLAARTTGSIRLRVLKVNPARRFYERLGFEVVGDPDEHWWEMILRQRNCSVPQLRNEVLP